VSSALVFVSPDDDLLFLDLLAGARIMRPKGDPRHGANRFRLPLERLRGKL